MTILIKLENDIAISTMIAVLIYVITFFLEISWK